MSPLLVHLPRRLRRPVETLTTLWSTGAFARPLELVSQWRHRDAFRRVQRALFYQRWANALLLAHQVRLFDALTAERTVDEVARACALQPRAVEALLRVVESQGLVARVRERWRLTPFGRHFLTRDGRHSIANLLELMAAHAAAFAELPSSMASGRVPGALDIFSEASRYPAFLDGVNEYLALAGRDLLSRLALPPPDVRSFIVGSMGVSFSALLLERFPAARVTYGCLPHLTREIPRLRERYRVPAARVDGMHEHRGDPTLDRWGPNDGGFDLVLLTKKMILAPDERLGEKFARKAFDVLRPGGVALLWETVHPDEGPTPLLRAMEAMLDLGAGPTALVNTEGGLRRLLGDIGFAAVELVPCLNGQTTFVVARKS
jgi:hypothetical protein